MPSPTNTILATQYCMYKIPNTNYIATLAKHILLRYNTSILSLGENTVQCLGSVSYYILTNLRQYY